MAVELERGSTYLPHGDGGWGHRGKATLLGELFWALVFYTGTGCWMLGEEAIENSYTLLNNEKRTGLERFSVGK